MKIIASSLVLVLTAMLSFSDVIELPKAPKGYTWKKCPEIKGAFLKPYKWHFKKERNKGTIAYFITKERIKRDRPFKTGVSINVIKNVHYKTNKTPSEYAIKFRSEAIKQNVKVEKTWDDKTGNLKLYGYIFAGKNKNVSTRVHSLLIANDKTGTLYIIMFESPVDEWPKTWEIAKIMLNNLSLSEEI